MQSEAEIISGGFRWDTRGVFAAAHARPVKWLAGPCLALWACLMRKTRGGYPGRRGGPEGWALQFACCIAALRQTPARAPCGTALQMGVQQDKDCCRCPARAAGGAAAAGAAGAEAGGSG